MNKIIVAALLWALSLPLFAQNILELGIPCNTTPGTVAPLRSCRTVDFEAALTQTLNAHPDWKKLIAQKKLAVGLVDLSDRNDTKFAQVNGDKMMYAASLPKIAILLSAMDALEKGELKDSKELRDDMWLMISKSNNQASTRMIDRLGYDKIERVLTDPKYKLYDKAYGGGLWVGKRYAAGGARHPDPMMGLSHAATVSQVCRFYYLMVNGQLVSNARSRQMLEIMANPSLHHKFVNTLEQVAPNAMLFRKSGSWQNFHSDSILVWGKDWRRYILVALTEDPDGEQIIRQIAKAVDEMLEKEHRQMATK